MAAAAGGLAAATEGTARTAWLVVLIVLFAAAAAVLVFVWLPKRRSRSTSLPAPIQQSALPPATSALYGTHVLDLAADIDTTADAVATNSDIDKWTGSVTHRPGVPSPRDEREAGATDGD